MRKAAQTPPEPLHNLSQLRLAEGRRNRPTTSCGPPSVFADRQRAGLFC